MRLASRSGTIGGAASWALEVTEARRTVILTGFNGRVAEGLAAQTQEVLEHFDQRLAEYGMTRRNVVYWDIVCDPSVGDEEFRGVVMPALEAYFAECDPKPAAGMAKFARVLRGRLVEIEMVAME